MPVDLDNVRTFAEAIIDSVSLAGPDGQPVPISRTELLELVAELEARREQEEANDYANDVADDLRTYAIALQEGGGTPTLEKLVQILNQETSTVDPGFLATARAGLMAFGLTDVTDEQIEAFLDLLDSYAQSQQGDEDEGEDVPQQQLVQQSVKAVPPPPGQVKTIVVPRPPGSLPFNGIPTPANPPPFVERTAADVFGMRRGPNGKWDSGDING